MPFESPAFPLPKKQEQEQQLLQEMHKHLRLSQNSKYRKKAHLLKLIAIAFKWSKNCYNHLIADPNNERCILHEAAMLGVDVFQVENFLYPCSNKAVKNYRIFDPGDRYGFTPVHYAALNGHLNLLASFTTLLKVARPPSSEFDLSKNRLTVSDALVFYYVNCMRANNLQITPATIQDLLEKPLNELIRITKKLQKDYNIQPISAEIQQQQLDAMKVFIDTHKTKQQNNNLYRFYRPHHEQRLMPTTKPSASQTNPDPYKPCLH